MYQKNPAYKDTRGLGAAAVCNEFMTRVRRERLANDWQQADVAKKIGVSQTSYSGYEKGAVEPPLRVVIALSDLFPGLWPDEATTSPAGGNSQELADQHFMPDESVVERIIAIGEPNLEAAAELLARTLPEGSDKGRVKVIAEVEYRGSRWLGDVRAYGHVFPKESWVVVGLDEDWLKHVDNTGLVIVDGVFILQFIDTPEGQPQRILGLRALPEYLNNGVLDGWKPGASPATIVEREDGTLRVEWDEAV